MGRSASGPDQRPFAITVHELDSQGKLNESAILDTGDVVQDDFRTKNQDTGESYMYEEIWGCRR